MTSLLEYHVCVHSIPAALAFFSAAGQRTMRRLLLITLLTALAPCMNAQRMGSASPRFAAGFNRGGFGRGGLRSSFYSLPLYDPLYADYLSSTGYPVASQPPLIILQSPLAAAPAPDHSASPSQSQSQPLMIELQGDRYVRVSGPEGSGAETEMIGPKLIDHAVGRKTLDRQINDRQMNDRATRGAIHTSAVPELPPAVLVFRDGHHEEASEYTITDGILYTCGDPYTGGPWNRKISLSSLNLSETIASSQSRGVRFRVPQSPNEVIVRP
jgi:hypothetical protein